jgi:predicted Zn-dependent protease
MSQIGTFIDLLETMPMEEAFLKAFQTSLEKMEKELREYVRNDRYAVINADFNQKLEFDSQMQTAVVSEAEAQAYLGDLLLHSNRAESEAYLQRALALDPAQPLANASLAMLRVRQGKIEEARASLERAVQANSQNYLIHYYYAYALSREGMNEAELVTSYSLETLGKIRDELKKAILLRPDFSESYRLMAFVNLVDGSQLDESIEFLKQGLKRAPGRNDLLLMLAQIYLRKEDFKSSRGILQRLSQNASDATIRENATNMLKHIDSFEQRLADFRAAREAASAKNSSVAGDTPVIDQNASAAKVDPSSYLREALRKPAEGEKQIQGTLLRVECDAKAIIFVVKAGEAVLKLRTANFEELDIVAFTTDAGSEITCGTRKPPDPIVVCYQPATDARAKVDGTIVSLEFVPREFKLSP